MIKVGWFCPVSSRTGIATYSRNVLAELKAQYGRDDLDLIICHPPTDDDILDVSYPRIEITEAFLNQDFAQMFDVIVYHLGNNDQHHGPIFAALMKAPGVVVLHDYVYQHYLAGHSYEGAHISPAYSALVQAASGAKGFEVLAASGVLRCDKAKVPFVPWESEWSMQNPFGDVLARLGLGAVVHSDYAREALGDDYPGTLCKLFMPRPNGPQPEPISIGKHVRIVAGGHIQSTKGLSQLVGAFTHEPGLADHFDVTIAGFGTDAILLEQLRSAVTLAGLESTIRFEVDPSEREFMDAMRGADIFYNLRFPNTEGASLSLSEQLSLGRPVIVYRTGSFAEVPQDACYFLDRIGDPTELADLLMEIAKNPEDVAQRGLNARKAVEEATAAAYATKLFDFLHDQQQTHARRQGLSRFRARGVLPEIAAGDAEWFTDLSHARQVLAGHYDRSLILPANIFDGDDADVGRFVSLGLLETRAPAPRLARLGAFLRGLPRLEAVELIGLMFHLARLSDDPSETYLPRYVAQIQSIQESAVLWRALSLLEPARAAQLAFVALSVSVLDDDRHDTIESAGVLGFATGMLQFLEKARFEVAEVPAMARIAATLREIASDQHDILQPSPFGENLLPGWKVQDPREPKVLLQNFHRVEDQGCWTSSHEGRLFIRLPDGQIGQSCTGRMMFIPKAGVAPYPITITVEEIATARSASFTHRVAESGRNQFEFYMNLDQFTGTLRVDIHAPTTHRPAEDGVSLDQRELGVMLQDLVIWPTPLRKND